LALGPTLTGSFRAVNCSSTEREITSVLNVARRNARRGGAFAALVENACNLLQALRVTREACACGLAKRLRRNRIPAKTSRLRRLTQA
jgi:hypothetical protein